MPYSYGEFKEDVKQHFLNHIPLTSKILDVGPGHGTYSKLLSNYTLDCIEIWEPYITQFNLQSQYNKVILGNITQFKFSEYEYIIMGDILEHLSIENAQNILNQINLNGQKCLIAVPYLYEQGEHEGNVYETHLQPDLTPEIINERYPSLKLLFGDKNYGYYINYSFNSMKKVLKEIYNNVKVLGLPYKEPKNTFICHFIDGAFLEVLGPDKRDYKVIFIDQDTNEVIHESNISTNMWTRTNRKYFTNWLVQVYDNGELAFEHSFNTENKRVYIHMDSSAIGDTLAWFPYLEEFRKKHNCELVVSTFHNEWFIKTYKNIEFVKPGTEVPNLYAMYNVGWFYNDDRTVDLNKNVCEFKNIPLGQTSSDILGLEYTEIKPRVYLKKKPKSINQKYVVIAPHASAHAKYWNYPGGWQRVINWLNDNGYKAVMITSEPLNDEWHDSKLGGTLKNVVNKTGNLPLENRMNDIVHASAFIGVGSGLSWLSWALGQKTVLISGFSEPYSEFTDCERIFTPPNLCSGCFNREWLNPGDWEWCPEHKDTLRQFECTKSITPDMVIKSLQKVLDIY